MPSLSTLVPTNTVPLSELTQICLGESKPEAKTLILKPGGNLILAAIFAAAWSLAASARAGRAHCAVIDWPTARLRQKNKDCNFD